MRRACESISPGEREVGEPGDEIFRLDLPEDMVVAQNQLVSIGLIQEGIEDFVEVIFDAVPDENLFELSAGISSEVFLDCLEIGIVIFCQNAEAALQRGELLGRKGHHLLNLCECRVFSGDGPK